MASPAPIQARDGEAVGQQTLPDFVGRFRLYLSMARPRVLALVLLTALPVLALTPTIPSVGRLLWILIGTAGVGAACSALNAYLERDIDAMMARTRGRPLPSHAVAPGAALRFGIATSVLSTAVLAWQGGVVAAAIGAGTIAFYVGVYTAWLKRRTPQNIVIGGAAGATAPLILDAAIGGTIGAASLIIFAIVFLWTPPHFWAVAIYRRRDYERAGIPMMPSVVGERGTRIRMLAYGVLLVPAALLPVLFAGSSWAYGFVSLALCGRFLGTLARFAFTGGEARARSVFKESNLFLLLLIVALCVDGLFGRLF